MIIDKNSIYSITEASEVSGVNPRTLTRLAVKLNKEKDNGRYLLNGFEIMEYLESKKKRYIDKDSLLNENQGLKDKVIELSMSVDAMTNKIKVLSDSNDVLRLQIDSLETQKDLELESLRIENESLKNDLKEDIPHQEKLQKAIELITLEAMKQNVTHKVFTDNEYQDLIGTISEVDFQTKQVEYLKSRVEKQDGILKELVDQVTQRNFIYAKDKGYDTK